MHEFQTHYLSFNPADVDVQSCIKVLVKKNILVECKDSDTPYKLEEFKTTPKSAQSEEVSFARWTIFYDSSVNNVYEAVDRTHSPSACVSTLGFVLISLVSAIG